MILTKEQIASIRECREKNYSYGAIAAALHLPRNTVKMYGYRHGMNGNKTDKVITIRNSDLKSCPWCGKLMDSGSRNTYCSKECRIQWHNQKSMEKAKNARKAKKAQE